MLLITKDFVFPTPPLFLNTLCREHKKCMLFFHLFCLLEKYTLFSCMFGKPVKCYCVYELFPWLKRVMDRCYLYLRFIFLKPVFLEHQNKYKKNPQKSPTVNISAMENQCSVCAWMVEWVLACTVQCALLFSVILIVYNCIIITI